MRLTRIERTLLLTLFDTILPSGASDRLPIGAKDVPLGRYVDDLTGRAPATFNAGLRACLWFVYLCPLFVIGRPKTFFGLTAAERAHVLDALGRSPIYLIREMPLLFKTVACLGYGGLPAVQRHLGIPQLRDAEPDWARSDSMAP